LLRVPFTWGQTAAAITCGAGSLHPVGFWHQRQSGVYYLYHFFLLSRLILDFALTLLFNHLVLTTYYSAVLPTSLFFWIVVLGSSFLTLLLAEQMCVKREMTEGLVIATNSQDVGDVEMGALRRD